MIRVTLNDILNNIEIFKTISEKILPIKTAYKIARLLRELNHESTLFDESRHKIIEKYAERTETGEIKMDDNNVSIQPNLIQQCNQELIDLLNTVLEINANKISLNDLEDIELSPSQILSLEPFIEE